MNMRKNYLLIGTALLFGLTACKNHTSVSHDTWIEQAEDAAVYQLLSTAADLEDSLKMPRTVWAGYELQFLEKQLEVPIAIVSVGPDRKQTILR